MISLWAMAVLCGGIVGNVPPADHLEVSATAHVGSGLSLTGSGGRTYASRSPAFLIAEVGVVHPDLQWLEFAPSVALEVEGRIGVALLPKIRARLPGKRVRLWGVAALPIFVAPYSLVGIQAGGGILVTLHRHLALLGEFTGTGYVWGSDLMEGSALGKLDTTFGVRVVF